MEESNEKQSGEPQKPNKRVVILNAALDTDTWKGAIKLYAYQAASYLWGSKIKDAPVIPIFDKNRELTPQEMALIKDAEKLYILGHATEIADCLITDTGKQTSTARIVSLLQKAEVTNLKGSLVACNGAGVADNLAKQLVKSGIDVKLTGRCNVVAPNPFTGTKYNQTGEGMIAGYTHRGGKLEEPYKKRFEGTKNENNKVTYTVTNVFTNEQGEKEEEEKARFDFKV